MNSHHPNATSGIRRLRRTHSCWTITPAGGYGVNLAPPADLTPNDKICRYHGPTAPAGLVLSFALAGGSRLWGWRQDHFA